MHFHLKIKYLQNYHFQEETEIIDLNEIVSINFSIPITEEYEDLNPNPKLPNPAGLTIERINQFRHFEADLTDVGGICQICMENFQVGGVLVELYCDGKHLFCEHCIRKWFSDHKSCPSCRTVFE